ncbi:MAG: DUF6894 family protein [Xanthobacteraceae bacterium]
MKLFAASGVYAGREAVDGVRYYFHVGQYPDKTGKVFSTREEAIAYASVLAHELAQDKGWSGSVISVTDEDARVIAQISVPS